MLKRSFFIIDDGLRIFSLYRYWSLRCSPDILLILSLFSTIDNRCLRIKGLCRWLPFKSFKRHYRIFILLILIIQLNFLDDTIKVINSVSIHLITIFHRRIDIQSTNFTRTFKSWWRLWSLWKPILFEWLVVVTVAKGFLFSHVELQCIGAHASSILPNSIRATQHLLFWDHGTEIIRSVVSFWPKYFLYLFTYILQQLDITFLF